MLTFNRMTSQRPPRRMLVTELDHVVRIRNGMIDGPLEPGRHRLSRRRDRVWTDTARPEALVVPSQEILTADGVTVRVTVSSTVTIVDPVLALRAGDWRARWYLEIQHSIRRHVTGSAVEDLLADRAGLDESVAADLEATAADLGIELGSLALRDLVLAGEPKRQLAEVVAARLAGQASLERARGEAAALRTLANAASLIKDNPALYRLRLLQEMSSSSGNTFVIDAESPM